MPLLPPPPSHTKEGLGGLRHQAGRAPASTHQAKGGQMSRQCKDKSIYQVEEFLRETFKWPDDSVRPSYSHTSPFRRCLSLFHTSPNPLQLILKGCSFPQHSCRAGFRNTHAMPCLLLHGCPRPNLGKFKRALGRLVLTSQDRAKQLELPEGEVLWLILL